MTSNQDIGKSCVITHDVVAFVDRLCVELRNAGYDLPHSLVLDLTSNVIEATVQKNLAQAIAASKQAVSMNFYNEDNDDPCSIRR
jgi:hypothetical protein